MVKVIRSLRKLHNEGFITCVGFEVLTPVVIKNTIL
jgi:hypothetical protein